MGRVFFKRCPRCGNQTLRGGFDVAGREHWSCEICGAQLAEAAPALALEARGMHGGHGGFEDE